MSHIRQNIPRSHKNNGKDIWSQNQSVCHLCLPTANPTPANKQLSLPLCSASCQKSKLGRSYVEKIWGVQDKSEACGHCTTSIYLSIYHSLCDRKILFSYLLCSTFSLPMPLIEMLRSNVTIACCRMKIFLMIRP